MEDFSGKIAVVTGGGGGMGRELVRQLVSAGSHVAAADIFAESLAETQRICEADGLAPGQRLTTHVVDVSDEAQVLGFRDEVAAQQEAEAIHLLFNNAGIAGTYFREDGTRAGYSIVDEDSRDRWERVFNISWYGVYYNIRAFMPLMLKADEARIINTSSSNGFWATLGPSVPYSCYSAAKFAIKGLTEAMIVDLRLNAPHIKCSVVMPGYIGTSLSASSRAVQTGEQKMDPAVQERVRKFIAEAPTSAAEAATIILDGVRADRWRILVGGDAQRMDEIVRADPEHAYDDQFFEDFVRDQAWKA